MEHSYDAVVIGGGAAGLSGALTLARARRSVLVVDAGRPRNTPAAGVHGFLTRDGIAPAQLVELGRAEVRGYGGEIVDGQVETVHGAVGDFRVVLADGRRVGARRLLVTTGLADELPDVEGLAQRWGRDVVHCPYCHGWEVRDRPLGVIGTSPLMVHQALLFRQWSADVTLLQHTAPDPTAEEAEQLAARGISVVTGQVSSVLVTDDRLTGVRLHDGSEVALEAVAVMSRMRSHAGPIADLGIETTEHPMGVGEHVLADAMGATSVPGVWAAGNVSDLAAQVVGSAAQGVFAAAQLNADLVAEDTRRAVEAARSAVA